MFDCKTDVLRLAGNGSIPASQELSLEYLRLNTFTNGIASVWLSVTAGSKKKFLETVKVCDFAIWKDAACQ
jgi:hypothetical protein